MRDIWRSAYGDDLPDECDPASFVTRTDLQKIVNELSLHPGDHLVDLGCGPGGPGSHVARVTGCRFTGIDSVSAAIDIACDRHLHSLPAGSEFRRGDFTSTGLPDDSVQGVMSTDALLFAVDQAAVFAEIARITQSNGRIAFTSFELFSKSESLAAGPISDYRPFIESAGFELEIYEETEDWKPRMETVFYGMQQNSKQVAAEMGEPAASLTLAWAELRPTELNQSRRIFAVARRR